MSALKTKMLMPNNQKTCKPGDSSVHEKKSIRDITKNNDSSVWVEARQIADTVEWDRMYATYRQIINPKNITVKKISD